MRIIVIGGSAVGLCAAMVLARDGHEVTVVERDHLEPAVDVETAAAAATPCRSPRPGDNRLRPLMTRRSTPDRVLSRAAAAEPRVDLHHSVAVTGLRADPGDPPRVRGVATDHGAMAGELVVVAGRT